MSGRKQRGRGKSKYVGSSNLHVIKPQVHISISEQKNKAICNVVKNTDLLAEKNKSDLKNSSLGEGSKMAIVKKDKPNPVQQTSETPDLVLQKKDKPDLIQQKKDKPDSVQQQKNKQDLVQLQKNKPDPVQQKKDIINKNQKPHCLSNFLALSGKPDSVQQKKDKLNPVQLQKNKPDLLQQKKDVINKNQKPHCLSNFLTLSSECVPSSQQEKKKKDFKKNFLALQQILSKNEPVPSKIVPQKAKAPIEEYKLTAAKVKKKPNQTKKLLPHHILGDTSSMPQHLLSKTSVKKKLLFTKPDSLERSKELTYHKSPLSIRKEDPLKARPSGSSKKFENQNKRDSSFWKEERGLSRSSLLFHKETKLKKRPRSSKDYSSHDLEDELVYYNRKYQKSKDKNKDYKWHEKRKYSESDRYSWYSKDYAFKKKYADVPHSSKKYLDFPQEERDFEELEDYEEVASIEDGGKDSKVPVRFRKCMVRYLPSAYTNYYFRPKWYFISRKRYVVNCLYASGKGRKEDESKLNLVNPCLEVTEGEFESDNELLEVVPDDEEMIEDVLVIENEEVTEDMPDHDNEDVTEDTSVCGDEEISGDASVHEEVTEDMPDHDNEDVTEDTSVCGDEEINGDASVHEEVTEDMPDHDNEDATEDALFNLNEGAIEDVSVHGNEETIEDTSVHENEETSEDVSAHKKVETSEDVTDHGKEDNDSRKNCTPNKEKKITAIDLCLDSTLKSNKVNSSPIAPKKVTESIVKNTVIEIIDLEDESSLPENAEANLIQADILENQNSKDLVDVSPRVFLKCISNLEFSSDFYQGDAAIQSSLCEWKSHLIGLEYMLEVRDNTDETLIKKYHCELCDQDLSVEKTTEQIVINHIISYTHMCNYMAKHFPSSDYKFSKSVRNCINEIVLQTCCEEINYKLGYHYMCIVKEHYFQNEYDKIKEHLNAMKHWDESDMDIYPTIISDQLESDIHEDVVCVFENMMDKLVNEPKGTFFTPQRIVSSLRRSVIKDKKNESPKINENIVNRCSQNTLIVLTPSPEVKAGNNASLPSAKTKSPKKLVTSSVTPKTSIDRSRTFNLLEVPVQDTKPHDLQSDITQSSSDIKSLQQEDPSTQEEINLSENADVDPSSSVSDTESAFKFNAKKPFNFRKYRQTAVSPAEQSDKESAVRIVRLRTSHNKTVPLESDEEEEVGLVQSKEGVETNEGTGADDALLGEDISDGDFPELEFGEEGSPDAEKSTPRSRSRNKQQHKKSTHSKYCPKRGIWIKGNSSDNESSLKDVNSSASSISTRKKYNFLKKSDECSQDSFASSTSKRKIRHRSSSSPSLEEFLRKLSPSPIRKRSKSPLRPYHAYRKRGSMTRRQSRSPYRRYSRSPKSRHSRSPYRKRSRSPYRKRSRSPIRKRSRSPIRKRSRSPLRKRSRSPLRKRSRSPIRKRSRSPIRKRSRSPIRKHSRSPIRKRSQSPYRKRSRSPYRRHSRSPDRFLIPTIGRARSPLWKGQSKRSSRSPFRKISGYKISRSPEKAHVKLPFHKHVKSPTRRSTSPLSTYTRPKSPTRKDSRISEDSLKYRLDPHYKHSKDSTKSSGSYKSTSNLSVPPRLSETGLRKELNDLEEVSDEDESKYFSTPDTPRYMEIIKNLPESARIMLVKVLQRFSITNINPNDPSFYELMKFVASHSSEIQRLMSQPSALPDMSTPVQGNPTVQSQESSLHQYILSGLKGNTSASIPSLSSIFPGSAGIPFQQSPGPSTSGSQLQAQRPSMPPNQFQQSVFQQPGSQTHFPIQSMLTVPPRCLPQHVYINPSVVQHPAHFQPGAYRGLTPQRQVIPPQPKVTSAVMFKDLKDTVSKIFGGDDFLAKFGIKIPGFEGKPENEKYPSNPPSVPQVNPESQTSFHGNRSGPDIQNEAPTRPKDNIQKSFPKDGGTYLSEAPRQNVHVPPPDAKVSFCDVQRTSSQRNLFPVVNNPETSNYHQASPQISVNDAKKSLAQRLASVLVKVGMTDVPAHLLQEMLMKIGAFSLNPPQDISEGEILGILRKLKYL